MNNCYEKEKHKNESHQGWKGKDKGKGKLQLKIIRSQNAEEKENVAPHKKFNVARQGYGSQQKPKGDDTGWLECWTCGKEHLKRDCPQNQGGRIEIYNAQEAQTVEDVGNSIPRIYTTLDNM